MLWYGSSRDGVVSEHEFCISRARRARMFAAQLYEHSPCAPGVNLAVRDGL